jgi:predicted MFS family arabinose efflux permease
VLFGLGQALTFLFSTLTYLVSLLCVLGVRATLQDADRERRLTRVVADIREGISWLLRQRLLTSLVILIGITNVVFTPLSLFLIVRAQALGASPALIGIVFALLGAGAVLGSVTTPWVLRRWRNRTVLLGSLWLWAALLTVLPFLNEVTWLGAAVAVTWATGPPFNVLVGLYRYALTPDHLQGRTQSAARFVAWGTIPLGNLLGGLLLGTIGTVPTAAALAGAMAVIAICASCVPSLRRAPQVDTLHPVS